MTVYGFHSLRHSFATFCANAGVPKAVVVSILGADSEIIDQFYTHVGEEAQIKALEAITGKAVVSREGKAEKKIQQILAYLDSLDNLSPELHQIRSILSK